MEAKRSAPAIAGAAALALAAGCASTQEIRVECVPEQVQLYVDGRLLEHPSQRVELRSDEPHKIFARAPGYEPRLVVLEPRTDADGDATLGESDLCIELVPIGMGRELRIEMEEDVEVER